MNLDTAEAEIRAFFDTAWASLTEIAWPDVEFTVPEGETWVRFNCRENEGRQVSMGSVGSNRFRHFGIVTIQIFQPQGQGSNDARIKAAVAMDAFMGQKTTNDIVFNEVFGLQVGNDGSGYFQINVAASFYYDEIT